MGGPNNAKALILMNKYRFSLKDCVDVSSTYFEQEYVLFRYNKIVNSFGIFGLKSLEPYLKAPQMDLRGTPENVTVFPVGLYYLPFDYQYKNLGKTFLHSAKEIIIRENLDFDLIHAHFIWPQGYVGARLKEEYKVPFIVTAHGYDIYSLPFKDEEWKKKIESVLNTADHIISVSQSNLACINKLNVATPVTVIPNGFRSDRFFSRDPSECRTRLNLPLDKKIILTVGSLEPVKGQMHLVDAVQRIITERKDFICVIVGDGQLHLALERQIRSLGLEGYISASRETISR